MSAALVTAAPASAASRGFTVTNNSSATLRLEGLNRTHYTWGCRGSYHCQTGGLLPMYFEGRPDVGDEIAPRGSHRFELYYAPGLIDAAGTAAQLTYKIEHTNAKLEVWIETTPYANNSRCQVVPSSEGGCTAGGLGITFTR